MDTSKNASPVLSKLLFRLRIEEDFWQGCLDAVGLAFDYKGDALKIREAITLFKNEEFSRLNIEKPHSDKYGEGFLKGLRDSLAVIDKAIKQTDPFNPTPIHTTRTEFELSWYAMPLTGKQDAFEYAISSQGDPATIKMEIEDAMRIIEEYEAAGRKNTSLMKYKQAYLEGLLEALKIIETFN